MMTSDRIDHVAAAREWLAAAERPDMNLDEATAFAHVGQAHATLALVEQQRVANLIALSVKQSLLGDGEVWVSSFELDGTLRPEIREALEL